MTLHDLVPLKHPERYLRTGLKHRLRYAAVKRADARDRAVARRRRRRRRLLLGIERDRRGARGPGGCVSPRRRPARPARAAAAARTASCCGSAGSTRPTRARASSRSRASVASGDCPPLVLAGPPRRRRRAASPSDGRVLLTGRVTDEELAALYSAADALVLPSEDEGFGLTPHEALACGTPVAAYAMPGPARDARRKPGGAARAARRPRRAAGGRRGTRRSGCARTGARTWADVARDTLAVYERAIARASAVGRAAPECCAHARDAHQRAAAARSRPRSGSSASARASASAASPYRRCLIRPRASSTRSLDSARLRRVLVHERPVGVVDLQPRLRERGDVRGNAARVTAVPDPRARLAHERRRRPRPGAATGPSRTPAAPAPPNPPALTSASRRTSALEVGIGFDSNRSGASSSARAAGRPGAPAAARRSGARPRRPPSRGRSRRPRPGAGDRVALRGELARLPGVVGVQQRDPVALAELRERGLARRRGAVAALVADDGVCVGRALLLERRPHGLVQERRRRQNRDYQPNPHSGSVSG